MRYLFIMFIILTSYFVSAQATFTVDTIITQPKCHNTANGAIELKAKGGVPPFAFQWSNGESSSTIKGLQKGKYTATVTDNSVPKQSKIIDVDIIQPDSFKFTLFSSCGYSNHILDTNFITPNSSKVHHRLIFMEIKNALFPVTIWYSSTANNFEKKIGKYNPDGSVDDRELLTAAALQGKEHIDLMVVDNNGCEQKFSYDFPKYVAVNFKPEVPIIYLENKDTIDFTIKLVYDKDSIVTNKWSDTDISGFSNIPLCKDFDSLKVKIAEFRRILFEALDFQGCTTSSHFSAILKIKPDTTKTIIIYNSNNNHNNSNLSSAYLPTIFSPNEDGINDQLTIYGAKDVEKVISMRVFDQWGGLVFEQKDFSPNDNHYGWDGTYKGIPANQGIYTCSFVLLLTDGKEKIVNNSVQLSR